MTMLIITILSPPRPLPSTGEPPSHHLLPRRVLLIPLVPPQQREEPSTISPSQLVSSAVLALGKQLQLKQRTATVNDRRAEEAVRPKDRPTTISSLELSLISPTAVSNNPLMVNSTDPTVSSVPLFPSQLLLREEELDPINLSLLLLDTTPQEAPTPPPLPPLTTTSSARQPHRT